MIIKFQLDVLGYNLGGVNISIDEPRKHADNPITPNEATMGLKRIRDAHGAYAHRLIKRISRGWVDHMMA